MLQRQEEEEEERKAKARAKRRVGIYKTSLFLSCPHTKGCVCSIISLSASFWAVCVTAISVAGLD